MTADAEPDIRLVDILGWVARHWAMLTAITFVGYSVLALLRIAHGDAQVALALVDYADSAHMLLAFLVLYAQQLVLVILLFSVDAMLDFRPPAGERDAVALIGLFLSQTLALAVTPVLGLIAMMLILVGWRVIRPTWIRLYNRLFAMKDSVPTKLGLLAVSTLVAAALAIGLWGLVPSRPWTAAEALTTQGVSPRTVYVLLDTGDELVVLRESPRRIDRVDKADVTDRRHCARENPFAGSSVLQLIFDESPGRIGPPCP